MAFQEFTGRQYLAIDIASNFGLDKKLWSERLAWFDTHEDRLEGMIQQAKEPALYYAGVKAWRDVQAGKPIGYMISLDATSSGLQLLAALTGDRQAAALCNVIDTGDRENAYEAVYLEMLRRLGDEEAQISLDQTKNAIMTALYSSKAVPKRVFGEGAMLDTFYQTISDLAPGAWELNEHFLSMWNPDALSHDWVLPDNFHVHIKVMAQVSEPVHFLNAPYDVTYKVNAPMEEGRSLGANTIHSVDGMIVRELTRRCDYEPLQVARVQRALEGHVKGCCQRHDRVQDQLLAKLWDHFRASGYLSARVLDVIDAENVGLIEPGSVLELIESLPAKPFKVVSIHDCFRVLPHYGNDLRRQYNLQLELIAKSNLLSFLVSQILGRQVDVGKMDDRLHQSIVETNYALS